MNLVAVAMRRPVTVLVLILATLLGGVLALRQMPRDIFPDLGIPIIYVAQPYGGMDPAQMEGFIVNYYEYHFLYISGIEHVESKSIQGSALIKLQFHPATDMAQAMAETVSYVNRARAFMPTGTVPPFVVRFDAGSVPVGDLVFSSAHRTAAELQDLALNRVRPLFATLPGVSAPPPFGASQRSIVVSVDPDRLRAFHMSPDEVVNALVSANSISPSGLLSIGDQMPMIPSNAVVKDIQDLAAVPIRTGSLQTVFLRDVATIKDGADLTTGYALVNGQRTVYIPVTKRASASTLTVVNLIRANLARFQAVLPDDVQVTYQFDQSGTVTEAINGLTEESLLGALLTGLMVLVFLRDWRSVMVVVINIPLSLMAAILALWLTHQTINIMTLGGLALAVGILVDEATVTIENLHTHLDRGKPLALAAYDATVETIGPRLLAMLCILAVFTPSLFMTGAARALFIPMSLAVGFSMLGSYVLSSTLVPVLATWGLKTGLAGDRPPGRYATFIERTVRARWGMLVAYGVVAALVLIGMGPRLGTDIFPAVNNGQFQLRLRAPTGTRIEKTEALSLKALDLIRNEVGQDDIAISLGYVGTQPPEYPVDTIYLWTSGPEEAVLQVQLKDRRPLGPLREALRRRFAQALPDVRFSFEPSDIVSRVMSFGSNTPVEVAVGGPDLEANRVWADRLRDAMGSLAPLRDLQEMPHFDYPTIQVDVSRQRAGIIGVTAADVNRSLVAGTSSSRFTQPNFWADPKSGIGYQVQVEIPLQHMDSIEAVRNLPVGQRQGQPILLRNVAQVNASRAPGEYDRYNMQRTVTLSANIEGTDLGTAASQVKTALSQLGPPPPRVTVAVHGQIPTLVELIDGLRQGLALAVVVIFLLLAANFQSFRLAGVVLACVPAVLCGVVLALALTGTTLNIESYMGAIMSVGVSVANAILQVTFAERHRVEGHSAAEAALHGAHTRLRPILMTSLAMGAGMLPMALGLGQGGEQSAPLGRAVIGGLLASTVMTLVVLPSVFAIVQRGRPTTSPSLDPHDPKSVRFVATVLLLWLVGARAVSAADAPRLTLGEAIETAWRSHPALRRLEETRLSVMGEEVSAASPSHPQIALEALAKDGPSQAPTLGLGGLVNSIITSHVGTDVVLSQVLSDWGRTRFRTQALAWTEGARASDEAVERLLLAWSVHQSYNGALLQQHVVSLLSDTVESRTWLVHNAATRLKAGLASRVDLSLAQASLADAQVALVQADSNLQSAFAQLNAAMGVEGSESYALVDLPATGPTEPASSLRDDVAAALSHRPEIEGLRAQEKAAQATTEAARATGRPLARGGLTTGLINVAPDNLTQQHFYAYGVSLSVPLATGGQVAGDVAAAEHQRRALQAQEEEQALAIRLQVTQARLKLLSLIHSQPGTEAELAAAADGLKLATRRYQFGLGNIVEAEQAQDVMLAARLKAVRLRYDIDTAQAMWQYTMGGYWP